MLYVNNLVNMTDQERPGVGVATLVINENGKVLIGRDARKGESKYGVPGGHWENGETLKECARREVKEESGIDCVILGLITVYDFYREDKGKNYVTIGMKANPRSGEISEDPEEQRTEWDWYDPQEALDLDLFTPDRILIERYISGVVYE